MRSDFELLSDYAHDGSETAFRELVDRHLNLVFSTAMRHLGNPHLAQEVTQMVFVLLARKAKSLGRNAILAGWLYRTTHFTAIKHRRNDLRRQQRERDAIDMSTSNRDDDDAWGRVLPHLDAAMNHLGGTDRDAIVLRYFERKDFREVGAALGASEDAAQKRVARALEKLHSFFLSRGVAVPTATLASILATEAVKAAPVGIGALVGAAAVLETAALTSGTLGSLSIPFMTTLHLKTAAVVALVAAAPLAISLNALSNLRTENRQLKQQATGAQQTDEQTPAASADDLENEAMAKLRREAAEVYKLRNEVSQLRREREAWEAAQAENKLLRGKLQQLAQAPPPGEAGEDISPEMDEFKTIGIAKLNGLKGWMLAMILYADQNNGALPADFNQAAQFLPEETRAVNFDLSRFEIIRHANWEKIAAPAQTVVIREKEPMVTPEGKRVWGYGFADGHSEISTREVGDNGLLKPMNN